VAGLNSQSLIEAGFHGFKSIQFGDAFYGKKGFTHDFSPVQVSEVVSRLRQGSLAGTLTLNEYRLFEDFLVTALQRYLVSCHDSGVSRLVQVFDTPIPIALLSGKATQASAQKVVSPGKAAAIRTTVTAIRPEITSVSALVQENSGSGSLERKLHKLRRNPRKFFADSHNGLIKAFRHFFIA
jgi:hypothetical protein